MKIGAVKAIFCWRA